MTREDSDQRRMSALADALLNVLIQADTTPEEDIGVLLRMLSVLLVDYGEHRHMPLERMTAEACRMLKLGMLDNAVTGEARH